MKTATQGAGAGEVRASRRGGAAVGMATTLLACSGRVPAGYLNRLRAPQPAFDAISFFEGRTEGRGSLKTALTARQSTLVQGFGRRTGPSAIELTQTVRRGGHAPTTRIWQLRAVAPGRYAGTLSDASGPVEADVSGNRLHVAFPMKGGLRAQQWLFLTADGHAAQNRMVVTKLGIPVASLDEMITRTGVPDR